MSANEAGSSGESDAEIWRKKVADAERKYRKALSDFIAASVSGSDEAIAAAAKRRDEAREEFHRVLRIFSDLVIRGRLPGKQP